MFESALSGAGDALDLVPSILWWFFSHGGWIVFVLVAVWVLFSQYMEEIQGQFISAQEWVFLNIRVPKTNELSTLAVEQSFAQMHAILSSPTFAQKYVEGQSPLWYSLEMASLGGKISFVIRAPKKNKDLVEAALYAQYPEAEITEVADYLENFKYSSSDSELDIWGTELLLAGDAALPIKTYRDFEHPTAKDKIVDPLKPLFEAMSKIAPHEIFAVQIVVLPVKDEDWKPKSEAKAKELIEGAKAKPKPFNLLTALIGMFQAPHAPAAKADKNFSVLSDVEKERVNRVLNKAGKSGYSSKVRMMYMAPKDKFEKPKASLFLGAFKTFASANSNGFKANGDVTPKLDYKLSETLEKPYIDSVVSKRKDKLFSSFKGRKLGGKAYVLNVEELATIYHLPLVGEETVSAPNVDTVSSKKSQPPPDLPIGEY